VISIKRVKKEDIPNDIWPRGYSLSFPPIKEKALIFKLSKPAAPDEFEKFTEGLSDKMVNKIPKEIGRRNMSGITVRMLNDHDVFSVIIVRDPEVERLVTEFVEGLEFPTNK